MVSAFDSLDRIEWFAVVDYVEEKRLASDGTWCPDKWDQLRETVAANRELVDYLTAAVMRGERRAFGGRRSFSKPFH